MRGQARASYGLLPSLDRIGGSRFSKLDRERRTINTFRSTARFFSGPGEQNAFEDDFVALMVLQHYGVPTRLLDWSSSPQVAAYFATSEDERSDGALWAFSHDDYAREGRKQWLRWPETTTDGTGDPNKFDAKLTAFRLKSPPDWIIAAFYPIGFPRQRAQSGAYTLTSRFGVDHRDALRRLLIDGRRFHRYVLKARIKGPLRTILRTDHGIWRGSLLPDSAGAAESARQEIFG